MPGAFPTTPATLLSQLRDRNAAGWQVSWKHFLALYYNPVRLIAGNLYRRYTGGRQAPQAFIEDVASHVVADFFSKDFLKFDSNRGRLRTFLRLRINAHTVEQLRRENPALRDNSGEMPAGDAEIPEENSAEAEAFRHALLATLIEDLRNQIPFRQFEIFEMVKLAGVTPDDAAARLGVRRGVIDNNVYKAMNKLREIAAAAEYREEFYA